LSAVQNEGQPGNEPDPQQPSAPAPQPAPPTGADRYAFTAPEAPAGGIEFKRVRRESAAGLASSSGRGKRRTGFRGKLRTWHLIPAAVLVLVLVGAVTMVVFQGRQAANHLRTAAGLFSQLQQQIKGADVAAAQGTLAALQLETKKARAATDGVGWSAASHLPWVGDDLAAVRTVSEVLDDLSGKGLPALLDVAAGLDPAALAPRAGRIDLTSLTTAGPRIAGGLAVIRQAQSTVAGIETGSLTAQLADAVGQLREGLDKAETLVSTADRAATILPPMLGADGPRTYLVLFQNLAEVRATGGMPGAYIVIKADAGQVTITDQGSAAEDLKIFETPVMKLDDEMEALYTERPAVFPANVNLTPDFPTAAMLARKMYQTRKGVAVDGVLATDPVALSYLLASTGAVKLPKGEPLTATNAVRLLLSDVYANYPVLAEQDAYFAGAARATFEALLKGQGDPKGMITQLARAAGERRLLVWSADATEEAQLAGTVLEGRLPAVEGASPTVGVFLNDGSGAKLSYYLNQTAALSAGDCDDEDDSRQLKLTMTLGSTAPAAGLPAYVTGLKLGGEAYTVRTNVMVFSPVGGGVVDAAIDGKPVDFGTGSERDRQVGVITVDLPPGVTQTLDVTLQTGALPADAANVSPRLWTTPTVRPWKTTVTSGARCA
jgi:hypothetical protein